MRKLTSFHQIDVMEYSCRPFHAIGKQLMLITAQKKNGTVNTMTAGWGGLGFMWGLPAAFTVIRPQRYTKEFVEAAGRCSLCFFELEYAKILSYLGTVSGRDEDKIAKSGLELQRADGVPFFSEASTVMIVTNLYAQDMKESCFLVPGITQQWYPQEDYHTLYIGRVDGVLERG